ncbi:lysozyme inhibitor LprI family protein [uncultured Aureimonas sp.]|uniref:lysozyme inhibitor LprI family protein n=1 Tax=uncultured Aureimonas sp. TaxID=1604662 RepID=UPI00345B4C75
MRTYFCASRETAAWDELLNRNFQAQVESIRGDYVSDQALRDEQLGALRTAQRLWIQFRDAEMTREEKNSQNAMSTWILANVETVRLEMTARRAIDLGLD